MYEFTRVAYSRSITHSQKLLMEEAVVACQRLFKHSSLPLWRFSSLPLWDQMYMLEVISYGRLQKEYKRIGS